MNPPVIVVHGSALDHVATVLCALPGAELFQEAFKLQGTPLRIQFKLGPQSLR
jgi:GTP-binding protein